MPEPIKPVPRTEVVLKKELVQAGDECPIGSKIKVTPQQRLALEESGHIEAKKGES